MDGFEVRPDALRQRADGIAGVVDRLEEELSSLESSVSGFGAPWGNDDIGAMIGELYQAVHDLAMDSFETNSEVLSDYAQRLTQMADSFEQIETDVTAGMTALQSAIEG